MSNRKISFDARPVPSSALESVYDEFSNWTKATRKRFSSFNFTTPATFSLNQNQNTNNSNQNSNSNNHNDDNHNECHECLDESNFNFKNNFSSSSYYPLIDYSNLPPWLQDNPNIMKGYRINLGWKRSCDSACHMHNETLNVWTHFLGFLVVAFLLLITLVTTSPHGVDRLNIGLLITNEKNDLNSYTSSLNKQDKNIIEMSPFKPDICSNPFLFKNSFYFNTKNENESDNFNSTHTHPHSFNELLDRVNKAMPSLELLTGTLLSKAYSLSDFVHTTGPLWPSILTTQTHLIEYVHNIQSKLASLKEKISDLSHNNTFNYSFTASHYNLMKELESLPLLPMITGIKESVVNKYHEQKLKILSNDLLLQAEHLINDFYNKLEHAVDVRIVPFTTDISLDHALIIEKIKTVGTDQAEKKNESDSENNKNSNNFFNTTNWESNFRFHFPFPFNYYYHGTNFNLNIFDFSFPSSLNDLSGSLTLTGLHGYLSRWPLAVFLITAMCCLGFSAFFHLFQAVNKSIAETLQCLDYAGICLLITGSNVPVIYYGFYCAYQFQILYLTVTSLLGVTGFIISVLPRFKPLKYRELKTFVFLSMGLFGILPTTHLIIHFGKIHFIFWYLLAMGASYITGAIIYLCRVPERFWPGRFDYWFHSHQLWHVSIFLAVLTHYVGVIKFYEWRMQQVCT